MALISCVKCGKEIEMMSTPACNRIACKDCCSHFEYPKRESEDFDCRPHPISFKCYWFELVEQNDGRDL